jgi:hypothetical protein
MSQPASRPGSGDRTNRIGHFLSSAVRLLPGRRDRAPDRHFPRPVVEDPAWAIAASVQFQEDAEVVGGRIAARRHPTGWFLSASHPAGMSAEELADFRHFVSVRVYVLLHDGPVPGAWERGSSSGEWVADLVPAPQLEELDLSRLLGRSK